MAGQPPAWAREIVARRALAVTLVTALVHTAVVLWALPPSLETQAPVAVGGLIDLLGVVVTVLWARAGTTPADPALGPKAPDGTPYLLHSLGRPVPLVPRQADPGRGGPLPPVPSSAYPPDSTPLEKP